MSENYLKYIKQARELSGLSQKEVERCLDLRSLSLRDYETGRLKLPISVAIRLSKLYGVSLDKLVGNETETQISSNTDKWIGFHSLFSENCFSLIYSDPIIRGAFDYDSSYEKDKVTDLSVFELVTKKLSQKNLKIFIDEMSRLLIGSLKVDGRVSQVELVQFKKLMKKFNIKKFDNNILNIDINNSFYEKSETLSLSPLEKQFLIWILFIFNNAADGLKPCVVAYIEKVAQCLKVNRSNYILIENKFKKELIL